MTRNEVKTLLLRIASTYPNFKINPGSLSTVVDAWFMILEPDNCQLINDALTAFVRTDRSGYAPSPGQLHGLIADAMVTGMTDGEILSILTLASRNSSYGFEEEFNKMPPTLQKAVGSPTVIRSWGSMEPDQLSFTFNRIASAYKTLISREKKDLAINGPMLGCSPNVLIGEQ